MFEINGVFGWIFLRQGHRIQAKKITGSHAFRLKKIRNADPGVQPHGLS